MPADDPNGRPPAGGFEGFRSYADDSVREPSAPDAGPADDHLRLEEPGDGGPRRRRAPWLPAVAAGGVALALGAGVLLALGDPPPDAREAEAGATLPVEVAELPPLKAPPASTPLEVLPDAGASAAVDLTPAPAAPPPARPAEPADEAETPELALPPPQRDAVTVEPARPRADPCRNAPSRAEEMVCRDPDLAAADRRMRQAYEAALDAGVPEAALALEQQDWRDIREMAAQRSPRAVASIYRQRIEELQMMADETWR